MKISLRSVAFMFLVTLAFTALVSGVKSLSDRRISFNRDVKRQRVILNVLGIDFPESSGSREISSLFRSRVKEMIIEGRPIYQGIETDGITVRGYAFPVGGQGFWGPISGMAAVDPEATRLLGLAFITHSETPGLGGRISEPWFTRQFRDLALRPLEGEDRMFTLGPTGESGGPSSHLDAITGATNTSAAVEAFLNRDLDRFLRETARNLRTE